MALALNNFDMPLNKEIKTTKNNDSMNSKWIWRVRIKNGKRQKKNRYKQRNSRNETRKKEDTSKRQKEKEWKP